MSLQLAAASYIRIYYAVKRKGAAVVAKATVHQQGSVQRFKFAGRIEFSVGQWVIYEFHQSVSQWVWIFNQIDWRKKISEKDITFRKAIFVQEKLSLTLCFDSYDNFLSELHFTITKTPKKPHSTADSHHSSRQKRQERKEGQWSGRWRVTLHVQTCSGRNLMIPLMLRPNTESTPNETVTLPRNQLLTRYTVTSHVHTVTILCYGTSNVKSVYPHLTLQCGGI